MNERDQKVLLEITHRFDLKKKSVSISKVAKELGIPKVEMPIICDRLKKAGLIEYVNLPGVPAKLYVVPVL